MLDGQGDCNDITQNLAGLLACESLGQACKTHALQKTGKDSIHTCPVEMQGQTQANTQKASPFRLSNETFSCRMHTYARCCRPCERCQMSDDGGIACLHVACGILVRGCKTYHLHRRKAKRPSATSQVQARACSYAGLTRRESARESALQHRVRDLAQTKVMWAHAIHVRNARLVSVESGASVQDAYVLQQASGEVDVRS